MYIMQILIITIQLKKHPDWLAIGFPLGNTCFHTLWFINMVPVHVVFNRTRLNIGAQEMIDTFLHTQCGFPPLDETCFHRHCLGNVVPVFAT